tara:strand:- start:16 stop:204 length:189 start_codon:yes stop_codon:yes gene_type:complete
MNKENIGSVKKVNDLYTGNLDSYLTTTNDNLICHVPIQPDNTDYQAIQEWAAVDGNTIAEAD